MTDYIALLQSVSRIGFVGSRACTENQLRRLGGIAGWAATKGKEGVSGGAQGADRRAQDKFRQYGASDRFTVHLPWPAYNDAHVIYRDNKYTVFSDLYNRDGEHTLGNDLTMYAYALACLGYTWGDLRAKPHSHRALFGRNALIVMDCELLVYSMAGDSRGTTHDINIANLLGIPTLNVNDDVVWDVIKQFLISEAA